MANGDRPTVQVEIPERSRPRLQKLYAEAGLANEKYNDAVVTVLEALGHSGKVVQIDIDAGLVILEVDGPTLLPVPAEGETNG